ncbi:hypothetical protein Q7P37_004761 [Cladosporium fusiforme]
MDQSRALNALEPFLALTKSATSPRAASDLVTQATSAPNTYVFAELLQHPNIRSLENYEQYHGHFKLLETFAWGTWESYKASSTPLPALSDAQARKLRLLSLLTIASEKAQPASASTLHNLSYPSLCARLDLDSPLDLEQLVTSAIYDNLLTATLNPSAQTVVITSVAPLRDLAPGSVEQLLGELSAWSGRCDSVLADLQAEVSAIEAAAVKRAAREQVKEKQVKAAVDATDKGGANTRSGRQASKVDVADDLDDGDAMEVDADVSTNGGSGAAGKKRSTGMAGKLLGKMGR